MRSKSRSLRLKLTLWFVLVFFAIETVLTGTVVYFRGEVIRRSLDNSLAKSAEAMVENILAAEASWLPGEVHALVPADSGFVLYAIRTDEGGGLVQWNVADLDDLPFSAWEKVPAGRVGDVFTSLNRERASTLTEDAFDLRLVTVPFRRDGRYYYFQAAVRDRIQHSLGPFFDLVVIGVPVGVFAAMVAAWVIAGRAVAPIRRLSRAAQDVSVTNLSERIHVSTTDQEVSRLEEELNSALARIEAGYEAQSQFIGNVSHELKTPISTLLIEAQVAKIGSPSVEKGYAFVDRAERELRRLGRLVESILTLARADLLQERALESVSVNDVVLQSVQHCKPLADQKRIGLIPNLVDSGSGLPEPTVTGAPELLETMLENLVRNAVAHSPDGASVAIDAGCAADTVQITVHDSGPGIPDEYIDRVFRRFVRAPNRDGRDGSGLGLAIAHTVARLHGGDIAARNNEHGGCSFVVTLPLEIIAADRRSRSPGDA